MDSQRDWRDFRETIIDPTRRRQYTRAIFACEDAENEAAGLSVDLAAAQDLLVRAQRRVRRLVERIESEQRMPHREPPTTPPRREPPVIVPGGAIDPGRAASDMSGAPERVEPIWPSVVDAAVFADGTYMLSESIRPDAPLMPGMARDAYAAVEATLDEPRKIVLGIYGNVGRVSLGHAYSKHSDDLFKSERGWPIDVAFVGFNGEAASVGPVFVGSRDTDAGVFDVCKSATFLGVGINGESGTYAFRQHGYVEELIFDKVWINPHPEVSMYMSAFNLHKDWERMTLKRYEPRGLALHEHVAYLKPGGFTQILDCNLWGGRRTGFQARPHESGMGGPSPKPHGAFISDGNFAESFGWNHKDESGGQWMTVWCSLEYPVRISNNRCTDARYGCLGISKGTHDSGPYLTEDGLSHSNVYIWGNDLENRRAKRSCVSLADARMIHFGEGNSFAGPLTGSHTMTFGSQWGHKNAGAKVPDNWAFYGEAAMPLWPAHLYLPESDSFELLDYDDHRAHLVVTR